MENRNEQLLYILSLSLYDLRHPATKTRAETRGFQVEPRVGAYYLPVVAARRVVS